MPGIFVDMRDDDLIQIKSPYFEPYTARLRKIDGARWGGDDDQHWLIPVESAEDLDEEFRGELIYITPRHELLGIKPPKPPRIFKEVPTVQISGLKMKPYDFQLFGANFLCHSMVKQRIAILGDLMGTGKTFQALMSALQMKQAGRVEKVLIVVLAATRPQWIKEIAKFTNEKAVLFAEFKPKISMAGGKRRTIKSIDEFKQEAIEAFNKSDAMFMVMSYQGFQQNEKLLEKAKFDMVIFDEAHYMNNKDGKTNKAATVFIQSRTKRHRKGIYRGVKHALYASGTPVTAYPDQTYGLIRTGNPALFGTFRDFKEDYLVCNDYGDVVGYRNLDKLRRLMQGFMIRRTDKELSMSLPKIVEEDILIEPTSKQLKLDKELKEYQKDLIDQKNALLRSNKRKEAQIMEDRLKSVLSLRRQASNHPNLFQMSPNEKMREKYAAYQVKDDLSIPKLEKCLDMVREIVDNGHKVVIFTESRRMTGLLHKHIKSFTRAVRYIGGLSDKVRERRKDKFNNDPSCRVLIANAAGSTGLNLQAGKYLINYDLPDTPAIWEQRKYRIRRLDSTHDRIFIYNLINIDMVDQQIYVKIKDKQAAFDAVVENDKGQTELHRKMDKKAKPKKKRKKVSNHEEW